MLMPLIVAFLVLAIPVCLIVGIVLFILAKDKLYDKKVKTRVLSAILAVAPIVLIFVVVSVWGLLRIWQTSQI